jgi:hypothetical protein
MSAPSTAGLRPIGTNDTDRPLSPLSPLDALAALGAPMVEPLALAG